jgi:ribosomal protein S27E
MADCLECRNRVYVHGAVRSVLSGNIKCLECMRIRELLKSAVGRANAMTNYDNIKHGCSEAR